MEHKEYAEACSTKTQKVEERDGAVLLEKVLGRDNLNRAYKRVKANNGACGVDGMTIDEALPWLKEHGDELLDRIRKNLLPCCNILQIVSVAELTTHTCQFIA